MKTILKLIVITGFIVAGFRSAVAVKHMYSDLNHRYASEAKGQAMEFILSSINY
ncbi:MAG: hypothetical protein JST26_11480 [Bacteroidetes bacterium]|nr:hypothetical protein [Bacteroidota bacterium]